MASGKLGSAAVPALTNTTLFVATPTKVTTFNIGVCNTSSEARTFRLAICVGATPVDGEYLEYEVAIGGGGVWERSGLVVSGGEYIVLYASGVGLNVRAWGFEQ